MEVLAEADMLSQVDPCLFPEQSKYLLEIDFSALQKDSLVSKSY